MLYVAPDWGAEAPESGSGSEFSFEVIKDGVVLSDRFIFAGASRCGEHFFLGRQEDCVDFVMAHPSISRVHAAIHYRTRDGALMLVDLGSAQGTLVNKKACTPGTYERLYVGDVIKFGASSRIYCVHGPATHTLEEYDSENLRAYRSLIKTEAAKRADNNSISWGMHDNVTGDDDDDGDDDDEEFLSTVRYLKSTEDDQCIDETLSNADPTNWRLKKRSGHGSQISERKKSRSNEISIPLDSIDDQKLSKIEKGNCT